MLYYCSEELVINKRTLINPIVRRLRNITYISINVPFEKNAEDSKLRKFNNQIALNCVRVTCAFCMLQFTDRALFNNDKQI